MTEEYTYNCYICGAGGCTKEDYNGDGIFVCKDCNRFASAANLLLNVPVKEVLYCVRWAESHMEEIEPFEREYFDSVYKWLDLVKKDREA